MNNETTTPTPSPVQMHDAFAQGYDARIAGKDESSNPYDDTSSVEHLDWNDGWIAADEDEEDGL